MNVMEINDWYGTVTMENRWWYISAVIVLFALQVYLFWRSRD
tara:strand:- start:230 stop:355 length:126 start_codon:yes stop_codon:yes gene_type:complete